MLKVGYGAMVLESLLAVIALCVPVLLLLQTPWRLSFFVGFGLIQHFASVFMTMCGSPHWP